MTFPSCGIWAELSQQQPQQQPAPARGRRAAAQPSNGFICGMASIFAVLLLGVEARGRTLSVVARPAVGRSVKGNKPIQVVNYVPLRYPEGRRKFRDLLAQAQKLGPDHCGRRWHAALAAASQHCDAATVAALLEQEFILFEMVTIEVHGEDADGNRLVARRRMLLKVWRPPALPAAALPEQQPANIQQRFAEAAERAAEVCWDAPQLVPPQLAPLPDYAASDPILPGEGQQPKARFVPKKS